jgi:hypothetical protein
VRRAHRAERAPWHLSPPVVAFTIVKREAWGFVVIATLISWLTSARASEGDGSSPGLFGPIHLEAAGLVALSGTQLSSPHYGWPGPGPGGGVGARAGASYLGIYGGLTYVDYLSEGDCTEGTSSSCGSSHGFSYGVEGGYGRMFAQRLIVRAQLGIGDHAVNVEGTTYTCQGNGPSASCSTTTSHSSTHFLYLEPGLMVALTFGPVLAGVVGSVFFMPQVGDPSIGSTTFTQFRVGAQLGVRL